MRVGSKIKKKIKKLKLVKSEKRHFWAKNDQNLIFFSKNGPDMRLKFNFIKLSYFKLKKNILENF